MNRENNLSEKAQTLFKTLVDRYVAEGIPVGSKTLAEFSELPVSSATVRNVMSDLEERGLVISPHTSAGRVPTPLGYRFFVDSLIQIEPMAQLDIQRFSKQLDPDMSAHELIESASSILSEVSQMAGLVTIPRRDQTLLRHVEFLPLNDNRVLVILVLDDHEVQNRVIYTTKQYSEIELKEASNFINHAHSGKSINRIRDQIISSMKSDRENMNGLMVTTLELAEKALEQDSKSDYVMAGQENLVEASNGQALEDIRNMFRAFSLKGDILHLLDRCMETEGIQLFIGEESGYELLDECSVVTSPYQVDGELVGVLGVIGPTRMAYSKIIPIVDATARILSAALDTNQTRN
ncbi:MAG: heat-inducible transcriptional repressor [Candidatus Azotimanducaceae bacterium]|jgi:heat-inducible transcriptional repressor